MDVHNCQNGHDGPKGLFLCCMPMILTVTLILAGNPTRSSPFSDRSTQVKVMAPSLLLSLNRNKKVPDGLSFNNARSFSLLTNPTIYLKKHASQKRLLNNDTPWYKATMISFFKKNVFDVFDVPFLNLMMIRVELRYCSLVILYYCYAILKLFLLGTVNGLVNCSECAQ